MGYSYPYQIIRYLSNTADTLHDIPNICIIQKKMKFQEIVKGR